MNYSKLKMKEAWATCPKTGWRYKARYGFDGEFALRHKQEPYLSVCHDRYEVARDGRLVDIGGGVLSQEDANRLFPGPIADLIPFHRCSHRMPMHYLANVLFFASDRDHWGLRKGERRQIRNGSTNAPCWELLVDDGSEFGAPLPSRTYGLESETEPPAPKVRWFPWCRIGEGKEREFDAARRAAIWPEATDEQLSAPPDELRAMLEARVPALLERMRAACEAAGLIWPED